MAKEKKDQDEVVGFWLDEIAQAKKREKKFRATGERILDIYDGTKASTTPFNILFSNTETLLPAIYSTIPRPVVQRRFKDDDPMGKHASTAGVRMLEFLLDTNLQDYDEFDTVMRHTVLDAVLPGRGQAEILYDVKMDHEPAVDQADEDADVDTTPPSVTYETVCLKTKGWNRVTYGYAKKWSQVPWMAYEEYIDKAEATRLFGKKIAGELQYTQDTPDEPEKKSKATEEAHQGKQKTACVQQIWDRRGGKKVLYVSAQYPDGVLKEEDDPLQLSGFFPCPKPLQFIEKTHSLIPTAPYVLYENQAIELNKIQLRINRLIEAMKVRAVYDSAMGTELAGLLEKEENELIPAETPSALAAEKGLQNAIWFWPIDLVMATVEKLYAARDACKQVIYEITGISDILRGATQASETATAQQIKNQWGTLRLKRMQKEVARYARDLLRIMLELAATKFSEETWAKMTGLPFLTSQQAQPVQQLAAIAQATGQPLDPQTQAKLQAPIWGQILDLLRDDMARAYRIDIETNSTVEPDATEDKQHLTELFTAMGQLMASLTPLVVAGTMPFQVAQSLLLLLARQSPYGKEVEDSIKAMQPPQPEGQDDGQAQAEQLKAQQQQMELQLQAKQQQGELDLQMKTHEAEKKLLEKQIDLELKEIQLKADMEKFALAQQVADQKIAMKESVHATKVSASDQIRTMKDATSKKTETTSKEAETKLADSANAITEVTKQMADFNTSLLTAIENQAKHTAEVLEQVTKAVTAPKVRKAVRGKDGRIEAMEETVT